LDLSRGTPEERVQHLCRRLDGDHEDCVCVFIDSGVNNKDLAMIATSVRNSKSLKELKLVFHSDFAEKITLEQVEVLGSMIVGSTTLEKIWLKISFKLEMNANALLGRLSECNATNIGITLLRNDMQKSTGDVVPAFLESLSLRQDQRLELRLFNKVWMSIAAVRSLPRMMEKSLHSIFLSDCVFQDEADFIRSIAEALQKSNTISTFKMQTCSRVNPFLEFMYGYHFGKAIASNNCLNDVEFYAFPAMGLDMLTDGIISCPTMLHAHAQCQSAHHNRALQDACKHRISRCLKLRKMLRETNISPSNSGLVQEFWVAQLVSLLETERSQADAYSWMREFPDVWVPAITVPAACGEDEGESQRALCGGHSSGTKKAKINY